MGILRVFKGISRIFPEFVKAFSGKVNGVERRFKDCYEEVPKSSQKFPKCCNEVSRVIKE